MEIDMIVVMVLALMFFGGVVYLVIKERGREKSQEDSSPALMKNTPQPTKKVRTR